MEIEPKVLNAALAGLLHDLTRLMPDFFEQSVPQAWQSDIKAADQQAVLLASRLTAGLQVSSDVPQGQPGRLQSIFCSLEIDRQRTAGLMYWPIAPLALDREKLFPNSLLDKTDEPQKYALLGKEFQAAARRLRDAHNTQDSRLVYLENLLMMMQRYTWCIPSLYHASLPDVSLYDHSRMTAALAAIFSHPQAPVSALFARPESDLPAALLVGGDISGVQEFIYTISARGATSALRGRSFYLQLLTEAVARYTLRRLQLPLTNLVYAGGGHFYLLARPADQETLLEIQAEIGRALLTQHKGSLYLALEGRLLHGSDFFAGRISQRWGELGERLGRAKQRRFAELQAEELRQLFTPQGHGGNEESQCQVCGAEHPAIFLDKKAASEEDTDGVRKCPACLSYEELGEQLRQAAYLIFQPLEARAPSLKLFAEEPGDWRQALACFGLNVQVLEYLDKEKLEALHGDHTILALKDTALDALHPSPHAAVGRRLLVNVTPTITRQEIKTLGENGVHDLPQDEATKPFHALQAQAKGIQRLGVLRMDVDNLGRLFSNGLGKGASLARIASLSFAFSLFFEGWVENLAEQRNLQSKADPARGELLYSIYSGGDDLFFVGAWDEIVELARQIRLDLQAYAAGHPGVHASAGIVLVGGKYPLAQAAQDAGKAEEKAKHLIWWNDGDNMPHKKDALSFLGQAMPWERFGLEDCTQQHIHNAHALMHLLINASQEKDTGKVVTSLVHRLIGLYERYQEKADERKNEGRDQDRSGRPQALWGPWNWLSYYSLSRLYRQSKSEEVKDLRDQIKQDNFRSIEWIGLAARWAELLLR